MQESNPTTHLRRDMGVILALSCILFILLRSPLWIGDGVRWLNVVVAPDLPSEGGGNRHFLFPYVGWLVYHVGSTLPFGLDQGDPTRAGAVAIVQAWNALMAGASLALLYAWAQCGVSRSAAAVGVAVTGLSNAFLLHATNMTEPMTSLPPALLGLVLVTRRGYGRGSRLAAGGLIGLASAFYALAAFAIVPAALTAGLARDVSPDRRLAAKGILRGLEVVVASAVVFAATLATPRLIHNSENGVIATVAGVTDAGLMGMYGRLGVRHLIGAFGGFANAICGLPAMPGLSQIFHLPPQSIARVCAVFLLVAASILAVSRAIYRRHYPAGTTNRILTTAGVGWLVTIYFVAFYFLAGYDKIWLFAMPPLGLLAAVAFDASQQDTGRPLVALGTVGPALLLSLMDLFLVAVPRRVAHNQDLDAALRLASLVQPKDMIVTPGWDAPSVYAGCALTRPLTCVRLTEEAIGSGFQAAKVSSQISAQARHARSTGAHVYFLGLLDMSAEQWQLFFGAELHLPYALLDPYRHTAIARGILDSSTGPITVFEVVGDLP